MKENNKMHDPSDVRLSMKERIGYGIGDFANNMMFAPLASFMTFFYTDVAGISAGVVGTIMLLARLLDGVTDLIVGSLMEKTSSKKGKARPWILWWIIPYAVSLILLFSAPDFSYNGKVIYASLTYIFAVCIVYTAINIPFGTLGSLITKNQDERGYLNISKMIFAFGGGLFVNMTTLKLVDKFGGGASAWTKTFVIFSIIAVVCFFITYITTKERVTDTQTESKVKENISIKKGLESLFKNKYWVLLLVVFFMSSVANAFIGSNVYYANYIMKDTGLVGSLTLVQTIASFITFAASAYLISRIGKQKIAFYGTIASLLGFVFVTLNPTSYMYLHVGAFIKGIGNAAVAGVCYGMLADTVEYNEFKSGIRAEGLIFSASSIGGKIGTGLGSALVGWILNFFGYNGALAVQPDTAIQGIRVMFLYAPIFFFAIMAILLYFYDLDKKYDDIVEKLMVRNSKEI